MSHNSLEAFIDPMIAMAVSQFPRKCGNCGREFGDFRQFVSETRPIGHPTILPSGRFDPIQMISWTNCPCGSTLVLTCVDDAGGMHEQFVRILEEDSRASGKSIEELLSSMRAEVRRRVLGSRG